MPDSGHQSVSWSIRRVRRGDGQQLRALRLEALRSAPTAFLESYAAAERLDSAGWEARIERSRRAGRQTLIVGEHGGSWCGMLGAFVGAERDCDDFDLPDPPVLATQTWAMLWGMFVQPAARGSGLADRLLAAVYAWAAQEAGVDWLGLDVLTTNAPAINLYCRNDFQFTTATRPYPSDQGDSLVVMVRPIESEGRVVPADHGSLRPDWTGPNRV
ncbi:MULTISPECIES: GNAT family N-acetyltransferase [unclassified Nocardia]|uniref:GNAT family N-acetyltransferase n=1 Tax=unclassified Nocardia TaxID=2637762 RepID=UPI001CE482D6|nr:MULTISPECIES: GNAT family N-acetyltransferase [unclassified Nocardia]